MPKDVKHLIDRAKKVEKEAYQTYVAHRLAAEWHREVAAVVAILGALASVFTLLDWKIASMVTTVMLVLLSAVAAGVSLKTYQEHISAANEFMALRTHALNFYSTLALDAAPSAEFDMGLQRVLDSEQNKTLAHDIHPPIPAQMAASIWAFVKWR